MFTIEINPGVLAGMIAFTSNPFAYERGFLASNLHVKRADLAGTVIAHNALASESHGSDPRSPLSLNARPFHAVSVGVSFYRLCTILNRHLHVRVV